MAGLQGGPSYRYSYLQQEMDPTELQYLQEQQQQYLQESQQLQPGGGGAAFQAGQSYTQSYWQAYQGRRGAISALGGFGAVPEDREMLISEQPMAGLQQQQEQGYQRRAEAALNSWKTGDKLMEPQPAAQTLSSDTSTVDLRDFLSKRGKSEKQLQGLHKLAAQGDRTGIMKYMKQHGPGAPIDELDSNGYTPLMYAAMADSEPAIEMLLNFRARREQTDSEGRTAVHYAAFFGKHRALKFLISTASNWTPSDNYGRTPLHWSCMSRSTQSLVVLIKHAQVVMGSIDPRDHEGMTPLHCAAHFCRPRHIALLSEAQCDFNAVDFEQKTALHWTASNPDSSCIQVLVDLYPALLNKQDFSGSTILHLTVQAGAIHLVTALVAVDGIDLDIKDRYERTALHWAAAGGHSEITHVLLNSRALDSCIDADGLTALHHAIQSKSAATVEAFAGMMSMTHLPNTEGRTPLMDAAATDFPEAIKLLLKNRAVLKAVDQKDPQGFTSLHLASFYGSSKSVSALLSKKANPNILDLAGRTPIFLAAQNGHGDCIQQLISKGCKVDIFDEEGQSPLHVAVMYSQLESVQVMAINGINLNIKDASGNTSLHMAAYGGNNSILTVLLEQSANPNLQDSNGVSAVHLAAMEGHVECLETLIAHSAYLNFVDFSEERYTAVDYARLHRHTHCVEVLTAAGGVATEEIRGMAALTIQTAYRGYRARGIREDLALKRKAATCISKNVRGFLQRRRFAEMKRRHYSAIKIQAYYRGSVERARFQVLLREHREQKRRWKMIEDFSKVIQEGHQQGLLKTFTAEDLSPQRVEEKEDAKEARKRERKLRLETSMKMRAMYEDKQRRWQEFRDAEKQRRIDKANQLELDRLNAIIAESRARRAYANSKFERTLTIRSYHQAAVIIQRAFRRTRFVRAAHAKLAQRDREVERRRRGRAAMVLQRWWRKIQLHRVYKATHFRSIMTGPVIAMGRQGRGVSPPVHSYEREIAITGSPKRKMHQTLPSGFEVFRPLTRDLLCGRQGHTPLRDTLPITSLGTGSNGRDLAAVQPHRERRGFISKHGGQGSSLQWGGRGKGRGYSGGARSSRASGHVTLPNIFVKRTVENMKTEFSPSHHIKLPEITP